MAVDMSDPEAPQEKGMIKLGGFQYGVESPRRHAYSSSIHGGEAKSKRHPVGDLRQTPDIALRIRLHIRCKEAFAVRRIFDI